MAYANIADINKILPADEDPLPLSLDEAEDEEQERIVTNVQTVLEEATDLIVAILHREYVDPDEDIDGVPDDVPGAVRRVCARMSLRAFSEDPEAAGAEATTNLMGPFSHTINWRKEAQDRSVYISDSERERLDPYILGYSGGAAHYAMYTAAADASYPFYYHQAGSQVGGCY